MFTRPPTYTPDDPAEVHRETDRDRQAASMQRQIDQTPAVEVLEQVPDAFGSHLLDTAKCMALAQIGEVR